MRCVFKYYLGAVDTQQVELPGSAEILHVANQEGLIVLWALVEPSNAPEARTIRLAGTGHPIQDVTLRYINTFEYGRGLIFHAFEVLS